MNINKKTLLAILLFILTGVIAYKISGYGNGVVRQPEEVSATADVKMAAKAALPELRLDLLDAVRPDYSGVSRDIFAPFHEEPKVKPKPKEIKKPEPIKVEAPPPPPPPLPPPPSRLDLLVSRMKFIGFLEKGENRKAFFTKGNEVIVLKKLDVVENCLVTELTDSFISLRDEENQQEKRIDFTR